MIVSLLNIGTDLNLAHRLSYFRRTLMSSAGSTGPSWTRSPRPKTATVGSLQVGYSPQTNLLYTLIEILDASPATYEDLGSADLSYLDAVVQETLRCASTITFTSREALVDTTITSKDGRVWPIKKNAVLYTLLGRAGWESTEAGKYVI